MTANLDIAALVNAAQPAQLAAVEESWERVDLAPTLAGETPQMEPTLLRRDDDRGVFYAGTVNGIHADSGIGKTWVAALTVAQELLAGRRAMWLHFEDPNPTLVVSRLRLLGVPDATIRAGLDYRQPSTPVTEAALRALEDDITDRDATVAVVDSLGEAFGIEGLDENKDTDVGPWMRKFARRLEATGTGVVVIDHATKAADNPLHPSGSKRKRAAITGASYLVEAPRPLTKESGGRLRLICAKDRHGNYARGAEAASLEFTVYPDQGMTAHVWAPASSPETTPSGRLHAVAAAAVDAAKTAGRPVSQRELIQLMDCRARDDAKRAGIDYAVADDALRVEQGPRRSLLHLYVRDLSDHG